MTILSVIGVMLIFSVQAYIVYVNFGQTRDFISRESNTVLEEAYNQELNLRQQMRTRGTKTEVVTPPPPSATNTDVFNLDEKKPDQPQVSPDKMIDRSNISGIMNTAIDLSISKDYPLSLQRIDSIAGTILKRRGIQSGYCISILNPATDSLIQNSGKRFNATIFSISSKYFPLDFDNGRALRLSLINPFESIFKRMGTMLITSFLISLFCFYGLWYLFRTWSRQKKLMEVKNDFFGNTAHELKRPVAQLRLALDALAKPGIEEHPEKKARYLNISQEATRDMSEKITMIMTLSMAEEGVFKLNYSSFNLLEEVEKLKEQFSVAVGKEVNISIENEPGDYTVRADRDHFRQCIANLIDNAIKYSGLSVLIKISLSQRNNELKLSVSDNGIGIDSSQQNKIFQKYTRLHREQGSPSGFGIGLSYVQAVIEKHAGHIELRSESGKGSEFILYLPN